MDISYRGVFIFLLYVFLFVNQAVLIKASNHGGYYSYNTTLVVLLTEVLKITAALSLAIWTHGWRSTLDNIRANSRLFGLYAVPALLYCIHNNFAYFSLSIIDPTSYYVLLQLRVLVTGVFFQCLFQKRLTRMQWLALTILFLGCVLKECERLLSSSNPGAAAASSSWSFKKLGVLGIVLIQVVCSSLAAVYTEYLLKTAGDQHADVHLQNVFMYAQSILFNIGFLLTLSVTGLLSKFQPSVAATGGGLLSIFSSANLAQLFSGLVPLILINGTVAGLTTAFLLKYLDSVLKVYANALEIVLVAFASRLFLNIPISWLSMVALLIVIASLYLHKREDMQKSAAVKANASSSEGDNKASSDSKA